MTHFVSLQLDDQSCYVAHLRPMQLFFSPPPPLTSPPMATDEAIVILFARALYTVVDAGVRGRGPEI